MVTELRQGLLLTDSITLCSCGSHIEKLVTATQPGGSGFYAARKKHLRFSRPCGIALRP